MACSVENHSETSLRRFDRLAELRDWWIMRLDTSQQMRTEMRLRMAPRMIQSMEILQSPVMALQERIGQERGGNPGLVDLRESASPADGDGEEAGTTVVAEPEPESEPTEFDSL